MALPLDLPPSFLFAGQKESRIQIQYKLIARMDDESLNEKNKYPSLINKRLLIVSKYPEHANFDIAYDQY